MKNERFKLLKNWNNYLTLFLLFHPLIDMLTSIMVAYNNTSITIGVVIRVIFMFIGIYYLLFITKSNYKQYGLGYYLLLFSYIFIFLLFCYFNKGFSVLFDEIKWIIKVFYLPIIIMFMLCFYDDQLFQKNIQFRAKYLPFILGMYVLIIVFSNLLGISLATYAHSKTGYLGLFYSANEIGAIICILLPFLIVKLIKKKYFYYLVLLMVVYCALFLGTKTPFLGLIIVIGFYLFVYILRLIIKRNYKPLIYLLTSFVLIIVIIILVLPYTPLQKNLEIHANFLNVGIDNLFTLETLDRLILSDRLTFLVDIKNYFYNQSIINNFIGIGYVVETVEKTIEMDYFDLFYRYGYIGFTIYFAPLIYAMMDAIKKIRIDYLSDYNFLAYILSYSLCLILALVTGHVFTAPAVSIYCALIIVELKYY